MEERKILIPIAVYIIFGALLLTLSGPVYGRTSMPPHSRQYEASGRLNTVQGIPLKHKVLRQPSRFVDNGKMASGPASTRVLKSEAAQCTVNWNDLHQKIDGFGASSAWIGAWGWMTDGLSDSQADMFFSAEHGIGLSLLRNHIFPDGTTTEVTTMQKAQARGARVWSTPWSPPAEWKDNNDVINGGHLLASHYEDYACQLADYADNMSSLGINLYAISVQNEPTVAIWYESCLWSAQQIHDFIPYLYDALAASGMASTKILIAEDDAWRIDLLCSTTMNDANTAGKIGILGAHNYYGTPSAVNNYDKQLWQTEVSSFEAFDGSMTNALKWATNIHNFMTTAEVNAWHYWWLIPYNATNEGLTDQSGNPAKRMYVLGNYSKFVRPDYYRIGTTYSSSILASAYKDQDSGKFAIVVVNTSSAAISQTVKLNGFSPSSVTPWITSDSLSLEQQSDITVSCSSFTYLIPAGSVVTFAGQINGSTSTSTGQDSDGDGVDDACDNCPAACNSEQLDADNDGMGDVCDSQPGCGGCGQTACEQECSRTSTSTTTTIEPTTTSTTIPLATTTTTIAPPDTDDDGIVDTADNCPNNPNGPALGTCTPLTNTFQTCTSNSECGDGCCSKNQEDSDTDGTGDACGSVPGCSHTNCGGCGTPPCCACPR